MNNGTLATVPSIGDPAAGFFSEKHEDVDILDACDHLPVRRNPVTFFSYDAGRQLDFLIGLKCWF